MMSANQRPTVDLSKPRYDQSTYRGRYQHFKETTSVLNIFRSQNEAEKLMQCYSLVDLPLLGPHREGHLPSNTTEDELWRAKVTYDSSHRPDTGERIFFAGRMSFQAPGNMMITGLMNAMRSNKAQLVLQFLNQSFNAVVNYSNRSGDTKSKWYLAVAFPIAVGAAWTVAIGLPRTRLLQMRRFPVLERFVPLMAVMAANAVNIPAIRMKELQDGIKCTDDNGKELTQSRVAARNAISQTFLSRATLAACVMGLPAGVMYGLEKVPWIKPFVMIPTANRLAQILLVGVSFTIAVPPCLAIFPQRGSVAVNSLEPGAQESVKSSAPRLQRVYYNKGL